MNVTCVKRNDPWKNQGKFPGLSSLFLVSNGPIRNNNLG